MTPTPKSDLPLRWSGEPLTFWVRISLVLIAIGLTCVFVIAAWINPYGRDGQAATMATHRQLGFPPCNLIALMGIPCPSCGMTTSFALTVRADVVNAARANWVGMLLAGFCMFVIPWGLASAGIGRAIFVRSLERATVAVVIILFALMMLRWTIVLWSFWRN